jgi:hypothetical protein
MLTTTRWILRALNWLNWGLGIPAILFLLFVGFVTPDRLVQALANDQPGADAEVMIVALRWIAIILAPIIPLAHIILTKLIAMIDSVAQGTALSVVNAERLRQIAWALIGINLLDLLFGAVVTWAEANMGDPPGWTLSLTGWLAALMLFILARVFREGATMREELEGTV